jgi:hypothetical protein
MISASPLAGRWVGSYESCEESGTTRATLNLSEPITGSVSGTLQLSSHAGNELCSLSGIYMEDRHSLSFSVSSCRGATGTPEYLRPPHKNLLQLSGQQLSGDIEPQNPCMTAVFRRLAGDRAE